MKIKKRIAAFACAGIMTLGLSSAAFADCGAGKGPEKQERAGFTSEQTAGKHHSSHRKHRHSHHDKDRENRNQDHQFDTMIPEESPVYDDDEMVPPEFPAYGYNGADRKDGMPDFWSAWDEEPYDVPDLYLGLVVDPAETVVEEVAEEEKADKLTIDINDEEAMQELFQVFLQWMKENYTITAAE